MVTQYVKDCAEIFFKGVDFTWTWDNTMRAIIHDDRYRVLKTLMERKQVWAEYVDEMKKKEKVAPLFANHCAMLNRPNCRMIKKPKKTPKRVASLECSLKMSKSHPELATGKYCPSLLLYLTN